MKKYLLIAAIAIVGLGGFLFIKENSQTAPTSSSASVAPTTSQANTLSYVGKAGKDAIALLKEKGTIEQDKSGLVISINGRAADSAKREYWAFYVNGKLADKGPAEYQTADTDTVEWKIETY